MTKSQKAFMMAQPIPEVIITVFLVLGVCAKLWHPAWVLFLIIPVYYWLVAVYVKKPKKNKIGNTKTAPAVRFGSRGRFCLLIWRRKP